MSRESALVFKKLNLPVLVQSMFASSEFAGCKGITVYLPVGSGGLIGTATDIVLPFLRRTVNGPLPWYWIRSRGMVVLLGVGGKEVDKYQ